MAVPKTVSMRVLADSLYDFTGFNKVWAPTVKVKGLRVDVNKVTIHTNSTLSWYSWTPASVSDLKKRASKWVLGHEKGDVTIYTDKYTLEELITRCGAGNTEETGYKNLKDKQIALWPSHGMYYNTERDQWLWQRATLWTTVEDLFSQEYVRLLKKMLENANAKVYIPRPSVENTEIGESGMPRWTEGARYWLKKKGYSSNIWSLYSNSDYKDDMKCRGMWVNSLTGPIDLCLAFHTDGNDSGNDSTIIGTLCIYTEKDDDGHRQLADGRDRYMTNRELGDFIQTQIVSDLQSIAPEWTRRQLREANYCESRVPTMPSIILELLSHKNMADMKYGLDPSFRFAAARAVYKGMLRYLCGKSAVVQPLPVRETSFGLDGTIRWKAPKDELEPTAKPKYYRVYIQENEGEWKSQRVTKTQLHINLTPGVRYNCYVVAGNDGGVSFPGPTVSAYLSSDKQAPFALVIDAFDEVYGPEWFADQTYAGIVPGSYACEDQFSCAYIGEQWNFTRVSQWQDDDNCGWGSCHRDHAGELIVGNTHDYSARHGRVLHKLGISYSSTTRGYAAERMQELAATVDTLHPDLPLLDIITGRQRVPLDTTMCKALAQLIKNGGSVLLSGEHLNTLDTAFTRHHLHFEPHASHATRSGQLFIDMQPYTLAIQPNDNRISCPSAESIRPYGPEAKRMAWYKDSRCPAAVVHAQTLTFAFPLEATDDFEKLYTHAIQKLIAQ